MSDYPGNPSLAAAVKDRVTSTFQQTLSLYQSGNTGEVEAGCNLILQMDPMFTPARRLLEKLRHPDSGFDVASLAADSAGGSLEQAREAMTARDFQRVVQITTDVLTNDLMNDEARILSDEAREKLEAAPFVDQFVRKCEQNLAAGNHPAVRADLEKARALDPDHPAVRRVEQALEAQESAAPRADASAFVVETPQAPSARGSAQASDFGFTFEEEKPAQQPDPSFANFSFDSPAQESGFGSFSFGAPGAAPAPAALPPAAPPPAAPSSGGFSFDTPVATPSGSRPGGTESGKTPVSGEFDFSTASIETSPDDQRKIEQYLTDGDRAFEGGDFQQAIDLWSRVFLIDVTSETASERIERAKAKRREAESQLDAIAAAGVRAFEKKDYATARARFSEILEADPANTTARDYMGRMEEAAKPGAAAAAPTSSFAPPPAILDEAMEGPGYEGSLVPPEPAGGAPAPKKPAATKSAAKTSAAPARKLPIGMIAAAAAVVVLLVGGWVAWQKFAGAPEVDPAASLAVISQASTLGQQGKFDQAIAILQDIKPGDPQYDSALQLIADLQQKKSKAAAMIDGRPAAAFYQEQIAAGRAALDAHDYIGAKKAFEQAMRVKALPVDVKPLYEEAGRQVGKLDSARTLFVERKYQEAVASLEPMLQDDPTNKNIQRMLVDAHFNLGATALREERLPDAQREFEAVLKADPSDELARRSNELAQRYDGQPKDLLYQIYVKYLPLRQAAG